MVIQYNRQKIRAFDRVIECSCLVRNIENGNRQKTEVVFSENSDGSQGVPYSPQVFPFGIWAVSRPIEKDSPYMKPWFIPTDAHQLIDQYTVLQDGDVVEYGVKTGQQFMDWGYGLHNSISRSTLGCIRIATEEDLLFLVTNIQKCLNNKEKVLLEVDTSIIING